MRALVLALAVLSLPVRAQADGGAKPDTSFGLSDGATASLLTMVPGREVYSLFGHSALRLYDPASGLDRTYNYGTFDFAQPGFVVRFARGDLLYRLDTAPFADEVAKYQWLGRAMIEQTLALDAPTVRALYEALETNALPENRDYRYDFLFDNCSTRLLGIVDTALVRAGHAPVVLAPLPARRTFRQRLAPYLVGTPLVELGVDLGLGVPVDRFPTAREATFLPLDLAAAFDAATVEGRPLVARRDTVFATPQPALPAQAPEWPLFAALGVLAVAGAISLPRFAVGAGVFDATLFAVVGMAGVVLLLLNVATQHAVTRPNLNLAWAWPTHVAAAVALGRRAPLGGAARVYLWLAAVAAAAVGAMALLGVGPQVLPPTAGVLALAVALRAAVRARATP